MNCDQSRSLIRSIVMVIGTVATVGAHGGNSDPDAIHACVHKSNGNVRIVGLAGFCTEAEEASHWAIAGPQGPPGQQAPPGPQGVPGPSGIVLLSHHTWSISSTAGASSYTMLTGSDFQATTSGGPLLIQFSVHMRDNDVTPIVPDQLASCAPFINNQWAGDYGALPVGVTALNFFEGATQTTRTAVQFGWRQWNTARVYPNVPAGTYTFDVRCRTNTGTVGVNANGVAANPFIPSYISVLELQQ